MSGINMYSQLFCCCCFILFKYDLVEYQELLVGCCQPMCEQAVQQFVMD